MGSKNHSSGPKWVVKQKNLLEALRYENRLKARILMLIQSRQEEVTDQHEDLQLQEVNKTIETWFRIYHSVVLFVAAAQLADIHGVNTPEEGFAPCPETIPADFCLEKSYMLPAFHLAEEDNESLSGLKFEQMISEFKFYYQTGDLGRSFIHENKAAQPILASLLGNYEPLSLPRSKILATCKASVSVLSTRHRRTLKYMKMALKLLEALWTEQIEDHLNEVNGWLNDENPGSEGWWQLQFDITDLESKINALFANGSSETKKKVGQAAAVANFNRQVFHYVSERFEYANDNDISHGLKGILNKYASLDLQYQRAWKDLLSITRAAVAWQIFNQARIAVNELQRLLSQESDNG